MAMANGQRALAEQSGGRFLLGLGVSHVPAVEGVRGHVYGKPVTTMRNYLDAMEASPYAAPEPAEKPPTILAALGPRMLALCASHADGAHPYNVTPEHTAEARRILGAGKLLCPEVWVLLETDASKARPLWAGRRSPITCSSTTTSIIGAGWVFRMPTSPAAGRTVLSTKTSRGATKAGSAPGCSSIGMPAPTISASSRSARMAAASPTNGCWHCWRRVEARLGRLELEWNSP